MIRFFLQLFLAEDRVEFISNFIPQPYGFQHLVAVPKMLGMK